MTVTKTLDVQGLSVTIRVSGNQITLVDDVSFSISEGEVVGLVGESGCGKSITAMSLVSLLPPNSSRNQTSRIILDGIDVSSMDDKELESVRGARVGFIFQEPMSSLNPVLTIGSQLNEALTLHSEASDDEIKRTVIETLTLVGISNPELRLQQYPHELSGGLRQRVMIAMALMCKPSLLIADEPTTALDVTIQAQILDLLRKLQKELKMSILLITHDLGVVAENCDRVLVMYAGRIVESGKANEVFAKPRHPYTSALLKSSPREFISKKDLLPTIPGTVMAPGDRGVGCSFAPRCTRAIDKCKTNRPELDDAAHQVSCWSAL